MRVGTDALIAIRPLRESDREPISRLLVATSVFSDEEVAVALELIDVVLHTPGQKDYAISTAVDDDGNVVGYYCVGPTPMTHGTYDLYWIAVSPQAHDRGIGRQLLEHAEREISSSGGRLVIAETSSQPKYEHTRIFYKKNGYEEVARIKDYYKENDDLVVFGKYVSQIGR
jgi:ribosomal protein S18 acetylase RimI-like enzyme